MSSPGAIRFEEVRGGQALPPFSFEVSLAGMVAYAGATWDFHRFHYDADFVRARGYPAPFVDGQMLGAILARHLMDWAGPDAFVRRLSYRLRAMVHPGDRLNGGGVVTGTQVEDGRGLVLCELWLQRHPGTSIIQGATAAVELPV